MNAGVDPTGERRRARRKGQMILSRAPTVDLTGLFESQVCPPTNYFPYLFMVLPKWQKIS